MSETYEKTSFNLTKLVESTIISALLNKSMFFDNDFEPLVFAEYSKIKHLREKLELKGARLSRLSGSGSTVFGVFDSKQSLNQIQSEFPDNFCEVCKFL